MGCCTSRDTPIPPPPYNNPEHEDDAFWRGGPPPLTTTQALLNLDSHGMPQPSQAGHIDFYYDIWQVRPSSGSVRIYSYDEVGPIRQTNDWVHIMLPGDRSMSIHVPIPSELVTAWESGVTRNTHTTSDWELVAPPEENDTFEAETCV